MRILVMSDSHGDCYAAKSAVLSQSSAEIVVHCGDGADEAEEIRRAFPEKHVVSVRGNCDFCSSAPNCEVFTVEGKKIFVTHGHLYGVKGGLYTAVCAAREQGADILLFGHTHQPLATYDDGLYIMNPGSLRSYESTYGIIDITDKGVLTNIVKLK
ncbi:MAG: metallophosphoesterase [Eubacteriales bacterium]|nr:metallophosphoesterase [Eubacteriales bacterium]